MEILSSQAHLVEASMPVQLAMLARSNAMAISRARHVKGRLPNVNTTNVNMMIRVIIQTM
jgi:hypothetical protein